jgi:hypothetical protein
MNLATAAPKSTREIKTMQDSRHNAPQQMHRYSSTSSARPDRGSGTTVMPSALAVLRFRNISTFVNC